MRAKLTTAVADDPPRVTRMSKDDAVRITDTIAFIRAATVPTVHLAKRATVADLLRKRNDDNQIPAIISPAMSQGSNYAMMGRDQVQDYRHYRRAIILIRAVFLSVDRNDAARDVGLITDANLATTLGSDLDRVTTIVQDLTTKLALLKSNPVVFLQGHAIQVASVTSSGPMDYSFHFDPLSSVYNLTPTPDLTRPAVVEHVYSLHVQQYGGLTKSDRPSPPGGQRIEVDGRTVGGVPDLMVTTQLTGCAVVYYLNGASLVAAHVQPSGGVNGEGVCTNLRAGAKLSNAPAQAITGVFGAQAARGVDPNNYVTAGYYNYCIGVRSGGSWDLYAQQRPRSYGAAVGAAIVAWKIT